MMKGGFLIPKSSSSTIKEDGPLRDRRATRGRLNGIGQWCNTNPSTNSGAWGTTVPSRNSDSGNNKDNTNGNNGIGSGKQWSHLVGRSWGDSSTTTANTAKKEDHEISSIFADRPFLPKNIYGVPKNAITGWYGKRHPKVIVSNTQNFVTWHDKSPSHHRRYTSMFICPVSGEIFTSGRWGEDDDIYVEGNSLNNNGHGKDGFGYDYDDKMDNDDENDLENDNEDWGEGEDYYNRRDLERIKLRQEKERYQRIMNRLHVARREELLPRCHSHRQVVVVIWYRKKMQAEHAAAARALDCLSFREGGGVKASMSYGICREDPYNKSRWSRNDENSDVLMGGDIHEDEENNAYKTIVEDVLSNDGEQQSQPQSMENCGNVGKFDIVVGAIPPSCPSETLLKVKKSILTVTEMDYDDGKGNDDKGDSMDNDNRNGSMYSEEDSNEKNNEGMNEEDELEEERRIARDEHRKRRRNVKAFE